MFDNDRRRGSDRITTYGLFIDLPLSRVGMTETQVRSSGGKAFVGKMMMSRAGRAKERRETQGFIKILIDADGEQTLGASIVEIGGNKNIHSLLNAMYAEAPYPVIQRAMRDRADPDAVGRSAVVHLTSIAYTKNFKAFALADS